MRVWITFGLIAIAVGCSGKHEGPHAAKAPGMKMPTQRKLVVETGHLVIISADGRDYVHAHPLSEAQTAPDGAVEFAAHFPKPGIYKAWGQFQRGGSVFIVPFVFEHKGGKPMSDDEGA